MVGRWILDPLTEVRVLPLEPVRSRLIGRTDAFEASNLGSNPNSGSKGKTMYPCCQHRVFIQLIVSSCDQDGKMIVELPSLGETKTLTPFGKGPPPQHTAGEVLQGEPHTHNLDDELDEQRSPGINTMTSDWYHQMVINRYNYQMEPALVL